MGNIYQALHCALHCQRWDLAPESDKIMNKSNVIYESEHVSLQMMHRIEEFGHCFALCRDCIVTLYREGGLRRYLYLLLKTRGVLQAKNRYLFERMLPDPPEGKDQEVHRRACYPQELEEVLLKPLFDLGVDQLQNLFYRAEHLHVITDLSLFDRLVIQPRNNSDQDTMVRKFSMLETLSPHPVYDQLSMNKYDNACWWQVAKYAKPHNYHSLESNFGQHTRHVEHKQEAGWNTVSIYACPGARTETLHLPIQDGVCVWPSITKPQRLYRVWLKTEDEAYLQDISEIIHDMTEVQEEIGQPKGISLCKATTCGPSKQVHLVSASNGLLDCNWQEEPRCLNDWAIIERIYNCLRTPIPPDFNLRLHELQPGPVSNASRHILLYRGFTNWTTTGHTLWSSGGIVRVCTRCTGSRLRL